MLLLVLARAHAPGQIQLGATSESRHEREQASDRANVRLTLSRQARHSRRFAVPSCGHEVRRSELRIARSPTYSAGPT